MPSTLPDRRDLAASAHRLQLAADELYESAGDPGAVPELPETIARLEETLDRLATGVVRMSGAVADWSDRSDAITDDGDLPPEGRALRWHLNDVAARLRASSGACPATRQWAQDLLADERPRSGDTEEA